LSYKLLKYNTKLLNTTNFPIFFILGRERSGTTMLRVTLNNHSCINLPPECPFIMHLYQKYHHQKAINILEFINDLKKENLLFLQKLDYAPIIDALEKISTASFANFCKALINYYQPNKVILGDKNPVNSLFGDKLIKVFPNAKFIWIIRDYHAQINSMLKVNFEKKIISSLAARWVDFNKRIETLKNNNPTQVLLIKYEDLVSLPEKNYQKICTFLATNYEPTILRTDKHNFEFYPKHHQSLNEKINTKHINEWKTELSIMQIKICEMVAGNYGKKFGYKKMYKTNYFIVPWVIFGIIYGKSYIPFIRLMYALPLNIKFFINQKIIFKLSSFWKEYINYNAK